MRRALEQHRINRTVHRLEQILFWSTLQSLSNLKLKNLWRGRGEEGSGWGTHVYLWRIHFDVWQN